MKKYISICVMALGILLYSSIVYDSIIHNTDPSPIPSLFFVFFIPLIIYFILLPPDGNYYQYYWKRGGSLSQNFFWTIILYVSFVIQFWLVLISMGILLLILYMTDSLAQNSIIRISILLLYNPIFVYLVIMYTANWIFSKLGKTETVSKFFADDVDDENKD